MKSFYYREKTAIQSTGINEHFLISQHSPSFEKLEVIGTESVIHFSHINGGGIQIRSGPNFF